MCGIANAVVRHATLWEVVCANLSRAVARRNKALTAAGYVVHILLMLLVVDKGIEAREGTLLVLWLVTRLCTLNKYLFCFARIGVLPHIAQTHTRFHFVNVLTTSTTASEGIPLDFSFVHMHLELVSFRQYGHGSRRSVHTALRLSSGHALYTMYARFIFQRTVHIGTRDGKVNLLETTHGTLRNAGNRELPTLRVTVAFIHLEQVTGKQCCLVATRTGTNLHLHVLRILRILWNQRNLNFLLQLGLQGLVLSQFLTSHLLHFRVAFVG